MADRFGTALSYFEGMREDRTFRKGKDSESLYRANITTARMAAVNLKKYQDRLGELRDLRVQIPRTVMDGTAQKDVFSMEQESFDQNKDSYRVTKARFKEARKVLMTYMGIRKYESMGLGRIREEIKKLEIFRDVLESDRLD